MAGNRVRTNLWKEIGERFLGLRGNCGPGWGALENVREASKEILFEDHSPVLLL